MTIPTSNTLLVRLFLDTTGFTATSPGDLGPGHWSLRLGNTANASTDFGTPQGPLPTDITDGSITIQNIPSSGPFAPNAAPAAAPGMDPTASPAAAPSASATSISTSRGTAALASSLSLSGTLQPSLPSGLQSRLQNILDSPPAVTILHTLEQLDGPAGRQILLTIDQIADKYNLHDDVLDGILVDLGLG